MQIQFKDVKEILNKVKIGGGVITRQLKREAPRSTGNALNPWSI